MSLKQYCILKIIYFSSHTLGTTGAESLFPAEGRLQLPTAPQGDAEEGERHCGRTRRRPRSQCGEGVLFVGREVSEREFR
ncbi:hypothetical protein JRQ81_019266 [Phrynocephalus forsythii]|uniref:Uncharacterized protein n=1 Tax=Phrynocephalus forsythii TaxID=171643 RepID=A0A9Q0XNZ8_9SAUR|nr:hypothetical protein JRQ81_019266 [Phrynocephalus forsythii]